MHFPVSMPYYFARNWVRTNVCNRHTCFSGRCALCLCCPMRRDHPTRHCDNGYKCHPRFSVERIHSCMWVRKWRFDRASTMIASPIFKDLRQLNWHTLHRVLFVEYCEWLSDRKLGLQRMRHGEAVERVVLLVWIKSLLQSADAVSQAMFWSQASSTQIPACECINDLFPTLWTSSRMCWSPLGSKRHGHRHVKIDSPTTAIMEVAEISRGLVTFENWKGYFN